MVRVSYHDGEHYNSVRAPGGAAAAALSATMKAPSSEADDAVKAVAVGSGVGDVERIKAVLLDMGGNVEAAIEFLIAVGAEPEPAAGGAQRRGGGSGGGGGGRGAEGEEALLLAQAVAAADEAEAADEAAVAAAVAASMDGIALARTRSDEERARAAVAGGAAAEATVVAEALEAELVAVRAQAAKIAAGGWAQEERAGGESAAAKRAARKAAKEAAAEKKAARVARKAGKKTAKAIAAAGLGMTDVRRKAAILCTATACLRRPPLCPFAHRAAATHRATRTKMSRPRPTSCCEVQGTAKGRVCLCLCACAVVCVSYVVGLCIQLCAVRKTRSPGATRSGYKAHQTIDLFGARQPT